ncbi:endonuclease III [Candidatus Woesearchaeota archaeon]|nr:endonuclease III [Candidatus Woesearchaeota archaeon]
MAGKKISRREIGTVIRKISKEIEKYVEPSVTQIGKKKNPYHALISCVLSLRTKDEVTLAASARLFKKADTPQKMVKLTWLQIGNLIKPVNYWKTKAKNIRKISRILLDKYKGEVPKDFDKLLELPNVGRKTANIVMTYGFFEKDYLAIDTHCHRIPNRLGWIDTKTPEETEFALRELIPKKYWWEFNNSFVAFGQNICKPVKPLCWKCPVVKYCRYRDKNLELPRKE